MLPDRPSDATAEKPVTGSLAGAAARSKRGTVAVLLIAFVLYLPSLDNAFAMDGDPIASSKCNTRPGEPDPVISANYDSSKWGYVTKFFKNHYWWPESVNDGLYRPISVLSYGLVYQVFGRHFASEAMPQHAFNVLLHVWAVWLVIRMLVMVGAPRFVALLAGLLFGVHAMHSEVVAGIVGRAEIFSLCFGAQAVMLMARGGAWRFGLGGVLMFLAYGSKESSFCWVPFYFCFVLARGWQLSPGAATFASIRTRNTVFAIAAMLVPALLWWWLRHGAMQMEPIAKDAADFSSNPLALTSAAVRIMTGIKVWGYGLLLCFVPYKLSCIYSPFVFEIVESPANVGFLLSLAGLLGFLGAGLWWARRQPLLFFAMACFLGFSFVTSNVPMPIGTIFGERLYYTPSLGVCVLPGILWLALRGRGTRIFLAVIALWCAGNVAMAVNRTLLWRDSATLFFHDVESFPTSIDLHRKAAAAYASDGPNQDLDKAIAHLEEAKRLYPDYAHAYRQLGKVYIQQKKWRLAIAEFKQSYRVHYTDPPGAETMAFDFIGDCLRKLAVDSADIAAKRRLIGEAMTWYQKSLDAPTWGDKDGEAGNAMGDSFVQLSELETSPAVARRLVRRALNWYLKSVDSPEKLQRLSSRAAFKRLFKHGVDPEVVLSKAKILDLYRRARGIVGEDFGLTLLMGIAAYKAGLATEFVYAPLRWAIENTPADKRDENYYTAQLFYTDALLEARQAPQARSILQMLLGRPELSAKIKGMIRDRLAKDPRLR